MKSFRYTTPVLLGMALAVQGWADEPTGVPNRIQIESRLPVDDVSANQALADQIARYLEASGKVQHFRLKVTCQNGHVLLAGQVTGADLHRELLDIVRGVPGVAAVHDQTTVSAATTIAPVQAVAPLPPGPMLTPPGGGPPTPNLTQRPPEPTPVYAMPTTHPHMFQAPRMPPYAWPSYAPYNNFSRVAYPTKYPHKSWPFIGPVHPFPKVPLGWRSVTLQWEDGFWWLRRNPTGHDWWRIRYW